MTSPSQTSRVHASDIKLLILNKLGKKKAEDYFYILKKYLSMKITKSEFQRLCCCTIGKENVYLNNMLIRIIFKNASASPLVVEQETNTGLSRNSKISNCLSDDLPMATSGGRRMAINRGRNGRLKDRPSPLGYSNKVQCDVLHEISNPLDSQRRQELISVDSKGLREIISVEDGEEVEQITESPGVQSICPVTAPLGILTRDYGFTRKNFLEKLQTCQVKLELPNSFDLMNRLKLRLEKDRLSVTVETVNVLNNALDCYLKRMIKPCVELARKRSAGAQIAMPRQHAQKAQSSHLVSAQDFHVSMELNPMLPIENWPSLRERLLLSSTDPLRLVDGLECLKCFAVQKTKQ